MNTIFECDATKPLPAQFSDVQRRLKRLNITLEDVQRLRPSQWVNDIIIQVLGELLTPHIANDIVIFGPTFLRLVYQKGYSNSASRYQKKAVSGTVSSKFTCC